MAGWSKPLKRKLWQRVEGAPTQQKRDYFKWRLQEREPIKKFSDLKVGDHLVKRKSVGKTKLYDHHFLCVGIERDGQPKIMHYFGTSANAISRFFKTGSFGSGNHPGQVAAVQEMTLPHKNFLGSENELQKKGAEVERVVWPDELRRYPAEEIVKRARDRKNERYYSLEKNNCESFVMWCICGLNISLQSTTTKVTIPLVIVSGLLMSFFHLVKHVPTAAVEVVERQVSKSPVVGKVAIKKGAQSLSLLGCAGGVGVAFIVDVGFLAYGICVARQKWKEGVLISTRKEFIREVVDLVIVHSFRFGGAVVGMVIGQMIIPVPVVGGLLGIASGCFGGHVLGKIISKYASDPIASIVDERYGFLSPSSPSSFWYSSRNAGRLCGNRPLLAISN